MRVGILATGTTPTHLCAEFSSYAGMFVQGLGALHDEMTFTVYDVYQEEYPETYSECDGWLITGSKDGVYENKPWMQYLQAFIRSIDEHKMPLLGICFGHQIIAQALGGRVAQYTGGWGVGVHRYVLVDPSVKSELGLNNVAMCVFHQDQVVEKPMAAITFAESEFCPFAGLIYGSHILTVQGHPEFSRKYEGCLLESYETVLPSDVIAQARGTLYSDDVQSNQMLTWMGHFLLQAHHASHY